MQTVKIEPFQVIGISIRTTNENDQSAKDIAGLWGKFMSEGILEKIPNKVGTEILSLYANYDGDHTQPYDTILGCKVSTLDDIPEGMVGQAFDGGTYTSHIANGDLTKGVIYEAWTNINKKDLSRTFVADFEVFGEKAQDPTNAEVEIFVGVVG